MVATSDIAVAVTSAVFVAVALTLLAYLLTRFVRGKQGPGSSQTLGQNFAPAAATAGTDPDGRAPDSYLERRFSDGRLGICMGGCLILAAALNLVGTFVPLYTAVHQPGPSLYHTMHYNAIAWYFDIGLTAEIGYAAIKRHDRAIAAVVIGFCAPAFGTVAFNADAFTLFQGPQLHIGPARYFLLISGVLLVVALVIATAVVLHGAERRHPSFWSLRLGVLAALLVATTATMSPIRLPGTSLWSLTLLPTRWIAATIVNLVVLAFFPLLAISLADQTASFVSFGLAATLTVSVAEAALSWLHRPGSQELTIGFWLSLCAIAVLVLLGSSLHKHAPTGLDPQPATTGLRA